MDVTTDLNLVWNFFVWKNVANSVYESITADIGTNAIMVNTLFGSDTRYAASEPRTRSGHQAAIWYSYSRPPSLSRRTSLCPAPSYSAALVRKACITSDRV
jgi:hypothetical protein